MKKVTSTLAIALFLAFAMTSCKKDYTCVCTTTIGGNSTSQEISLGKQKKKDAESACSARIVSTSTASMACKLK